MLEDFDINGLYPHELTIPFHSPFLVDHRIMEHTFDFHAVGTGRIGVKDDTAFLEPLESDWFPVNFANSSWTRGPGFGDRRVQLEKHQGFGVATLYEATPLLPCSVLALLGILCGQFPGMESLLVEAGFIHFHISPCPGRTAVLDGVLNLGDMEIADEVEVPVHPFHRLVVDVCNQVDDAQGKLLQDEEEER